MSNLVNYAIDREDRKSKLRKVLRIRTSKDISARENLGVTGDIDFSEYDGPPQYFCFAYDLGDGGHYKNLAKVAIDFGLTIDQLRSTFPNIEYYLDGLYLYWRSLPQARFDINKLCELILRKTL